MIKTFRFICKGNLSKDCKGYEDFPTKKQAARTKLCFWCRKVYESNDMRRRRNGK